MIDEPDRDTILALDERRRELRAHFLGDVQQAKSDLRPSAIANRWLKKKRNQLLDVAHSGEQMARKNASLFGIVGAAMLLFVARKPISSAIGNMRRKRLRSKKGPR
jgi:hypothetical protein